ncbi:DUF421 domain-containing protein [Sphingomonas morindae]|uniref:DUF421 domain-containing protein n=1 Tax=Sphingomonas morindae TaxID=1541170 RepID=A0ABY4X7P3_9SPHN|nr:YetF domain-containing protein [Sphingomonas morindae]USI72911.1 DUF421 domain-containing protein [Sphingomonas morindae]
MGIILRAVLVYLLLTFVLRITTRRVLRSATPIDMVVIFIFGGLAVQAVVGQERSITAALLALFAISLTHVAVSLLMVRWETLGMIVQGTPVTLFQDGKVDELRLAKLRIQQADLLSEIRQQGLAGFDAVERIVVEHNGGLSVIPKSAGG